MRNRVSGAKPRSVAELLSDDRLNVCKKIYHTYTLCVILSEVKRSRSFAERSEWSKTKERSDAGISFDVSESYLQ